MYRIFYSCQVFLGLPALLVLLLAACTNRSAAGPQPAFQAPKDLAIPQRSATRETATRETATQETLATQAHSSQVGQEPGERSPEVSPTKIPAPMGPDPLAINLISPEGIGAAKLGMTLSELKQQLGPGFEFQPDLNLLPQWDAIAVRQSGQVLYYLLHPAHRPLTESDPIQHILTENPRFHTPEGISPGMALPEVVQRYGDLLHHEPLHGGIANTTEATQTTQATIQILQFAQQPAALVLLSNAGSPSPPTARLASIWVTEEDSIPASIQQPIANSLCQTPNSHSILLQCARQVLADSETLQQQTTQQLNDRFPAHQDQLQLAQDHWRELRLAECRYRYHRFPQGQDKVIFTTACQTTLTEERTLQLQNFLQQETVQFPPLAPPIAGTAPHPRAGKSQATGPTGITEAEQLKLPPGPTALLPNPLGDCNSLSLDSSFNACALANFRLLNQTLQAQIQQRVSRLSEPEHQAFDQSQQHWSHWQQSHCNWAAALPPPSPRKEGFTQTCLAQLTRQRQQQLLRSPP